MALRINHIHIHIHIQNNKQNKATFTYLHNNEGICKMEQ